jgi:hypothetical protein
MAHARCYLLPATICVGILWMVPYSAMSEPPSQSSKSNAISCSVLTYGATGDGQTDDSRAFQKAIDALAAVGKGLLYVPSGDYRIDHCVAASVDQWNIVIRGDGEGATSIHTYGKEGVFQFKQGNSSSHVTIRDLSFFAHRDGAGTAIAITQPEGGNQHNRTLLIQNVEIRGEDRKRDYFDCGIVVLGQYRPLFSNVVFSGPFGRGVTSDYSENSPAYRAKCGIRVDGSYAPAFQYCYVWSAQTGYSLVSQKDPGPEDAAFYRSFAVTCRVGIDISTPGHEPQLVVDACHINCRDVGLRISGRGYFQIVNNLMYNDDFKNATPGYTDILLTDCSNGIISGNIFHQPANANRIMIKAAGTTNALLIQGNIFHARGTTLVTEATCTNVVQVNNQLTSKDAQPPVVQPRNGR